MKKKDIKQTPELLPVCQLASRHLDQVERRRVHPDHLVQRRDGLLQVRVALQVEAQQVQAQGAAVVGAGASAVAN